METHPPPDTPARPHRKRGRPPTKVRPIATHSAGWTVPWIALFSLFTSTPTGMVVVTGFPLRPSLVREGSRRLGMSDPLHSASFPLVHPNLTDVIFGGLQNDTSTLIPRDSSHHYHYHPSSGSFGGVTGKNTATTEVASPPFMGNSINAFQRKVVQQEQPRRMSSVVSPKKSEVTLGPGGPDKYALDPSSAIDTAPFQENYVELSPEPNTVVVSSSPTSLNIGRQLLDQSKASSKHHTEQIRPPRRQKRQRNIHNRRIVPPQEPNQQHRPYASSSTPILQHHPKDIPGDARVTKPSARTRCSHHFTAALSWDRRPSRDDWAKTNTNSAYKSGTASKNGAAVHFASRIHWKKSNGSTIPYAENNNDVVADIPTTTTKKPTRRKSPTDVFPDPVTLPLSTVEPASAPSLEKTPTRTMTNRPRRNSHAIMDGTRDDPVPPMVHTATTTTTMQSAQHLSREVPPKNTTRTATVNTNFSMSLDSDTILPESCACGGSGDLLPRLRVREFLCDCKKEAVEKFLGQQKMTRNPVIGNSSGPYYSNITLVAMSNDTTQMRGMPELSYCSCRGCAEQDQYGPSEAVTTKTDVDGGNVTTHSSIELEALVPSESVEDAEMTVASMFTAGQVTVPSYSSLEKSDEVTSSRLSDHNRTRDSHKARITPKDVGISAPGVPQEAPISESMYNVRHSIEIVQPGFETRHREKTEKQMQNKFSPLNDVQKLPPRRPKPNDTSRKPFLNNVRPMSSARTTSPLNDVRPQSSANQSTKHGSSDGFTKGPLNDVRPRISEGFPETFSSDRLVGIIPQTMTSMNQPQGERKESKLFGKEKNELDALREKIERENRELQVLREQIMANLRPGKRGDRKDAETRQQWGSRSMETDPAAIAKKIIRDQQTGANAKRNSGIHQHTVPPPLSKSYVERGAHANSMSLANPTEDVSLDVDADYDPRPFPMRSRVMKWPRRP